MARRILKSVTERPKPASGQPTPAQSSLSTSERIRIRDRFFTESRIDPREFLQALNDIPGFFYFVKDAESRTLLNTREYRNRMGFHAEEEMIGKRPSEYLTHDLAKHYEADDQKVITTGQPLRNIIEIGFNEQGLPDWIVTDKYPLRDVDGKVVGIIGTMHSFAGRLRTLPHLGKVGKAADFIRDNLSQRIYLSDVAAQVNVSERHLQRMFNRVFGLTMQQFIIHSRVHAAAHRLVHTERPISEIAMDLGFSDQAAFSNTFRNILGMPPRAYRAENLKSLTSSAAKTD